MRWLCEVVVLWGGCVGWLFVGWVVVCGVVVLVVFVCLFVCCLVVFVCLIICWVFLSFVSFIVRPVRLVEANGHIDLGFHRHK